MRTAIIIDCMPSYRRGFYKNLFETLGWDIHVYCQSVMPGHNLVLVHDDFKDNVTLIKYWNIKKDSFVWQRLPFYELISNYDCYVVYGNPRFPSGIIFGLFARVIGKKIIIWNQFHTAGSSKLSSGIRRLLWKLFRNFYLYNDREVEMCKEIGLVVRCIKGMNNGLDQEEIDEVVSGFNDEKITIFKNNNHLSAKKIIFSCARLIKKNNFEFFINLLPSLVNIYPDLVWCVVGSGSQEYYLKNLVKEKGLDEYVKWVGAVYGQEELAPWYLSSLLFVHPSGAGLSINHAFGYGLPVITHNDYSKQMPEIYALEDGFNGVLYECENACSFIEKFRYIMDDEPRRMEMSKNAISTVRERYNTKVMSNRLVELLSCVTRFG